MTNNRGALGTFVSAHPQYSTPQILILFVTSVCNLKCEHCFYWKNLNQRTDLSFDEIVDLSEGLGPFSALLISGGEPFLRKELVDILHLFASNNQVKLFSIPTGATLPDLVIHKTRMLLSTLQQNGVRRVNINLSIDGLREFHDRQRGVVGSFDRAFQTYQGLAALKSEFPILHLNVTPTLSAANADQVIGLAHFIKDNMPLIDDVHIGLLRGSPRSQQLHAPHPDTARKIYADVKELFPSKTLSPYDQRIVDAVFEAKIRTLEEEKQVVSCQAGHLIGVIDADGAVRLCELREAIGNIREQSFLGIWNSPQAQQVRASIQRGECHCTHECFIDPSYRHALQNNLALKVRDIGVPMLLRIEAWKLKHKLKRALSLDN
jgi:MoaA/NifB/PqqE/SkfB family radical SAM enzyme